MPLMISTSFMIGTGFMKCRPMKRSGRSVTEASRVIEIDEVFEATRVSACRSGVSSRKIDFLISSFSVAASMARLVWPMAARVSAGLMWERAASIVAWSMWPRDTCRARPLVMVSIPAATRSGETSYISTS